MRSSGGRRRDGRFLPTTSQSRTCGRKASSSSTRSGVSARLDRSGWAARIPFEAIDRFAERSGIQSGSEFGRFERMIRSLDDEYLSRRQPKGRGEATNTASMKDAGAALGLLQGLAEKGEG